MGHQYDIKDLEQVLKPHLEKGTKILKSKVKCLTQPGENYGSLMLSVDVTIISPRDEEKTIHLVAKMCPPNQWLRKMFNIPVTFKKEEGVYKQISVALKEFEQEHGLSHTTEFFPKYFGSRLSLDPNSNEVDDDAVLLLENLKLQGFEVGDRLEGFDLQTSEAIVKALATFHSVALALKLKQPDVFRTKVLPNVKKMKGFAEVTEETRQRGENLIMDILKRYEKFTPYLDSIREYYRNGEIVFQEGPEAREPFATVGHSDLWVNNILIKKTNNDVKVRFIDFQIVDYGSPARDLIFFLYLSVQNDVALKNVDKLIHLYYDTFINTLKRFNCDTQLFTFSAFEEELQRETKTSQVFHCLSMAVPIFTMRGTTKPMEELAADDMYDVEFSDKFEPKLVHIISGFIKNGWI